MVLLSSTLKGRVLKFHSDAVDPNTLLVVSLEGREAISEPYQFQIELVSQDKELDLDAILKSQVFIGIKHGIPMAGSTQRGIATRKINGVLSSFEQREEGITG